MNIVWAALVVVAATTIAVVAMLFVRRRAPLTVAQQIPTAQINYAREVIQQRAGPDGGRLHRRGRQPVVAVIVTMLLLRFLDVIGADITIPCDDVGTAT